MQTWRKGSRVVLIPHNWLKSEKSAFKESHTVWFTRTLCSEKSKKNIDFILWGNLGTTWTKNMYCTIFPYFSLLWYRQPQKLPLKYHLRKKPEVFLRSMSLIYTNFDKIIQCSVFYLKICWEFSICQKEYKIPSDNSHQI